MRLAVSALWFPLFWRICVCKCPHDCSCDPVGERKRVVCEAGSLTNIPSGSMDTDLQVLVITAPRHTPNDLNLGRIFQNFHDLEEIEITHSNIPAIGDSSFWPGKNIRVLNLSHNNITILKETDFTGLKKLEILNLNYNNIATSPSAPFRFLNNLRVLFLSHNKLHALVPRFFFMLPLLEDLDLSGNPLTDVDPENLKDLRPLIKLNLSNCHLTRLHSLLYQQLPNLEELDLSRNEFAQFAPEEFRHLKKLRMLNLHGNQLRRLAEKTFDGHRFDRLDLGNNRLSSLATCTFCNTTVRDLNLKGNELKSLNSESLAPVAHTLKILDISGNPLDNAHLVKLIRPLTLLRWLAMSGTALQGEPNPGMFLNNPRLVYLDLSNNQIVNVTAELLSPLVELVELDLSKNHLHGLYPQLLDQLGNMTLLKRLLIHQNPWTCERCHVEGMVAWMRHHPFYSESCQPSGQSDLCLRCASPSTFVDKPLVALSGSAIPSCIEPVSQSQVLVSNSQVGLAVGVFIIVSISLIILIVIILYRRHGAVYYTHEDDRQDSRYASSDLNGGDYKKQQAIYVTSLSRIDEITEEKPCMRRNSYL